MYGGMDAVRFLRSVRYTSTCILQKSCMIIAHTDNFASKPNLCHRTFILAYGSRHYTDRGRNELFRPGHDQYIAPSSPRELCNVTWTNQSLALVQYQSKEKGVK